MLRRIVAFHRDAQSDWVAELDCGHRRHVRHRPPLSERAWVQSAEGRRARLGTELDCVACERDEAPSTSA